MVEVPDTFSFVLPNTAEDIWDVTNLDEWIGQVFDIVRGGLPAGLGMICAARPHPEGIEIDVEVLAK